MDLLRLNSNPENIILDKLDLGIEDNLKKIGFGAIFFKFLGTDVRVKIDFIKKGF